MYNQWVVCSIGKGYEHINDVPSERLRNFPARSVGLLKGQERGISVVWLVGQDRTWSVPEGVKPLDVLTTGDEYAEKICNVCHRLKPVSSFDKNQSNKKGDIRRPSCQKCRTDIDKRAPKTAQAKRMEKKRPKKGDPFLCPICKKRSIVGVTARIVADHDHHTGNIRDFICDSCNTGLGRFKNGQDCLKDAVQYISERDTLED